MRLRSPFVPHRGPWGRALDRRGWQPCPGRFGRAEEGVALLEFALILPILLMSYIGTIEVSNLFATLRKVDLMTRTIGEFVGGAPMPSQQELDGMLKASKVVLMPLDGAGVEIVVSAVGVLGVDFR